MEKPQIVADLEARYANVTAPFRCVANSTEVEKMKLWYEQMSGEEGDWVSTGPATHPTNGVQTFISRAQVPAPGYTFAEIK